MIHYIQTRWLDSVDLPSKELMVAMKSIRDNWKAEDRLIIWDLTHKTFEDATIFGEVSDHQLCIKYMSHSHRTGNNYNRFLIVNRYDYRLRPLSGEIERVIAKEMQRKQQNK